MITVGQNGWAYFSMNQDTTLPKEYSLHMTADIHIAFILYVIAVVVLLLLVILMLYARISKSKALRRIMNKGIVKYGKWALFYSFMLVVAEVEIPINYSFYSIHKKASVDLLTKHAESIMRSHWIILYIMLAALVISVSYLVIRAMHSNVWSSIKHP